VQCMYVYLTHDYIRMEITVLYLKFHGINCRFNGRKYPFTGSTNASRMNAHLTDALFTLLILMCFTPHSNDMTSRQSSLAEKI
jgi:hypothetical protein